MFLDRQTLKDELFGLVGFYQTRNPQYPLLTQSLIESRSTQYFNDAHSLLTIENIHQSIKNFDQYTYPAYNPATEYRKGNKVTTDGVNNWEYINNTPNTGQTPVEGSFWTLIDELSDYLTKAVYSGIDRMINQYQGLKKQKSVTKSIFNRVLLFNGAANYRNLETNLDKFVGLRIRLKKREQHLVTIINKIGHQFSAAFTGLPISIYHDSQRSGPIATFTINQTGASNFQWTNLTSDNILRYVDTYDAGGDFYIGYKQSDLATLNAQALNKDIQWNSSICSSCDSKWSSYYKQYSPYIQIFGFEVLESEMPGDILPDPERVDLTSLKNYGLNLDLTEKCDLTPFVLQEEDIMTTAFKYNVAFVLLESMAYNTRGTNQIANQVKVQAEKQLFSHREAWGSVLDRAQRAVDSLQFDFSGMNSKCMPTDDKTMLRVRRKTV